MKQTAETLMIRSFSLYFVQDGRFFFYENTPSLFLALEGGALDRKRDQTEHVPLDGRLVMMRCSFMYMV